jgi:hypothetical protein
MSAQMAQANTNRIVTIGDSIASHWKEDSPLRKHGDGKPLMDWPVTMGCHAMMWKVGDGILIIEHTVGIGLIKKMSYVINDAKGNVSATLVVKEFAPTTGEMKISVPNKVPDTARKLADPNPER